MDPRIIKILNTETDKCIPWMGSRTRSGYGKVGIKNKQYRVHRLICTLAHGKPKAGQEAAHSCHYKPCCNKRHLSWKTHAQNMKMGKVKNPRNSTLTIGQVRRIKYSKRPATYFAKRYGVSPNRIRAIRRGDSWTDV